MISHIVGLPLVVSSSCPEWSREARPRSPSRAARRARQGHPQHVRLVRKAFVLSGKVFMHPNTYAALWSLGAP